MNAMIQAVIHNTAKDTYHPAVFSHAPMPGPEGYKIPRYKSRGHHTDGFSTLDEAQSFMEDIKEKEGYEIATSEMLFQWDGEEVPAISALFPEMAKPSTNDGLDAKEYSRGCCDEFYD